MTSTNDTRAALADAIADKLSEIPQISKKEKVPPVSPPAMMNILRNCYWARKPLIPVYSLFGPIWQS